MDVGVAQARTGTNELASGGTDAGFAAALGVCFLAALALRLDGLTTPSLWIDELASWTFAHLAWRDLFGEVAQLETNPPGYYALLKLVIGATGESEFSMRAPSALAGALAVLPVALIARRAGGNIAAIAAAVLLAVSAAHIHQSQQARGYAILFLAVATALCLLGPVLDRGATPRRRILAAAGFSLACIAALYMHATATIAVASLFLYAFVRLALRPDRRGMPWYDLALLAGAALPILICSAWWLWIALRLAADPASPVSWIASPSVADTTGILASILGAYYLGRLKALAAILAGALIVSAIAIAWRRRGAEPLALTVALCFGVLALHGLSQVKPVLLDRTALILLVFALPLAGYAVAMLRPRPLGLTLCALLVALCFRGTLSRTAQMAAEGYGDDWRHAIALVTARAAPGDIVLLGVSPALAALPHYAPGAAPLLRQRVAPYGDNLDSALLRLSWLGTRFDPAEACSSTVWVIALNQAEEERIRLIDLPPGAAELHVGRSILQRVEMPPCPD